LAGSAGVIVGLLTMYEALGAEVFLDTAGRLGEDLIADAIKTVEGRSWRSGNPDQKHRNLTGLSHGAAGIAQALVELYVATGEQRYVQTAEAAFAYERGWYDAEEGNWPDFRQTPLDRRRRCAFNAFWCHGAPGIALSRLRAYEILGSSDCKREAETALQTTRNTVELWLKSDNQNYSLCHGILGNAEALLHGADVLGDHGTGGRGTAILAANVGIECYTGMNAKWPCGAPHGEEVPSLMLGLAGIGYFYLRLHSPATPSALLIRSKSPNWIQSQ
jgi:lantibiotic biosynthesis protein